MHRPAVDCVGFRQFASETRWLGRAHFYKSWQESKASETPASTMLQSKAVPCWTFYSINDCSEGGSCYSEGCICKKKKW